jgi:Lecithin retinol acyltransferase
MEKPYAWRCAVKHLANPKTLMPGTQLATRRRGYAHFGIYVGYGRVVHYAGRLQYPRGLVEEISLQDFAAGRPVYVGSTPTRFTTREDVVKRARSRLGERSYDLLLNNCEHFCSWCQTGEARSAQVDRLTRRQRLLVRAMERAILAVTRSVGDAARERRHGDKPADLSGATAGCMLTDRVPVSSLARVA